MSQVPDGDLTVAIGVVIITPALAEVDTVFIGGKQVYPTLEWAPEYNPGDKVTVQVNLKNVGGSGKLWAGISDEPNVKAKVLTSYSVVAPDGTYGFSFTFNMPEVDVNLFIQYGHIE